MSCKFDRDCVSDLLEENEHTLFKVTVTTTTLAVTSSYGIVKENPNLECNFLSFQSLHRFSTGYGLSFTTYTVVSN